MTDWKPTTLEDWRKMAMGHWWEYENEKRNHEATKNRVEMWTDQANAHERVLLRLLYDGFAVNRYGTAEARWKRAHRRFNELVDEELQKIWAEQEDSE